MSDVAVYAYCVVRASRPPSLVGAPSGIPHASPPEAVALSPSLWIILAEVPLAMYGPAALEPQLRDLDWVARVAVAHEALVEHFAARNGAVVPLKLFTMFSSRARAVQDVGRRRRAIQGAMRRIEGCEEWGVRITRQTGARGPAGAAPRSPAAHGAGAAFLSARKAARDTAHSARRAAAIAAARAFSKLRAAAKDARQRPSSHEPGTNPPLLDAAFLVPVRGRAAFSAEARRQAAACSGAGAQMTLTGPWPAYTFVASEGRRA